MVSIYKKQLAQPKNIDNESKAAGFYQEVLDHVAQQGYGNTRIEIGTEEGGDIVEEFDSDESKPK